MNEGISSNHLYCNKWYHSRRCLWVSLIPVYPHATHLIHDSLAALSSGVYPESRHFSGPPWCSPSLRPDSSAHPGSPPLAFLYFPHGNSSDQSMNYILPCLCIIPSYGFLIDSLLSSTRTLKSPIDFSCLTSFPFSLHSLYFGHSGLCAILGTYQTHTFCNAVSCLDQLFFPRSSHSCILLIIQISTPPKVSQETPKNIEYDT